MIILNRCANKSTLNILVNVIDLVLMISHRISLQKLMKSFPRKKLKMSKTLIEMLYQINQKTCMENT